MDHIFDPFFTTKPPDEGTGLGLSVVHGIVQKINGIITVYSEVNKGTTINVFVPIIGPEKMEAHQKQSDDLYIGTEKIMLVDDEQEILNTTQGILANFGYTVTIIADSRLALEELRKDPQGYDLIITDYMMPYLTGVELTVGIKEIRSDIPVILYSGYVNKDLEEASHSVGISKLLRKPIGTYELIKAIRMELDAK
jgi:CheY-like chemotaxis protein